MHHPQLDPWVAGSTSSLSCRHLRLVDRIFTESGHETDRVRCVECGAVLSDQTLGHFKDTAFGL
jgi:hypothetical protein